MVKRVYISTPLAPATPKPKRVAAYARVSGGRSLERQKCETLDAAEHRASVAQGGAKAGKDAMLHSLSAQVSYFSSCIQSHLGWIYAGTYADGAYTGTKNDRPESFPLPMN